MDSHQPKTLSSLQRLASVPKLKIETLDKQETIERIDSLLAKLNSKIQSDHIKNVSSYLQQQKKSLLESNTDYCLESDLEVLTNYESLIDQLKF